MFPRPKVSIVPRIVGGTSGVGGAQTANTFQNKVYETKYLPSIFLHFYFFFIKYIMFKILPSRLPDFVGKTRLFPPRACVVIPHTCRPVFHWWPDTKQLCDKLINSMCAVRKLGMVVCAVKLKILRSSKHIFLAQDVGALSPRIQILRKYKGGLGLTPSPQPLSLIFYKNFITCAKEI